MLDFYNFFMKIEYTCDVRCNIFKTNANKYSYGYYRLSEVDVNIPYSRLLVDR